MTLPFRVCEQPREMSSLASSLSKRQTHLGNIGASSTRCNVCQLLKLLIGRIVQENLGTSNRFSAHVHKKINAIHEHIAWKKPRKQKKSRCKTFLRGQLGKDSYRRHFQCFFLPGVGHPRNHVLLYLSETKRKTLPSTTRYIFSGAPLRQQPVIEYPKIDNYMSSDNWKGPENSYSGIGERSQKL